MAVGGGKPRAASVRAVVESGIAVMGHVGLLPQSISVLGGFRPQGQTAASALQVIKDALVGLHLPPHHLAGTHAMRSCTACHGNARTLLCSMHNVAVSDTKMSTWGGEGG